MLFHVNLSLKYAFYEVTYVYAIIFPLTRPTFLSRKIKTVNELKDHASFSDFLLTVQCVRKRELLLKLPLA